MEIAGKRVLVTGSGGGLGLAMAEEFAQKGAHVIISDIREEAVTAAVEKITGAGDSTALSNR